jgi:hypothetical protein
MDEPYPGGPGGEYQPYPGGEYQPYPGGGRQPDDWPDEDWFRPRRDQEREPEPYDVAAERGRGGRHRHAGRRRPDPDPTVDLNLLGPKAGPSWLLITGTVFFLADTLLMADGFARPVAIGSRVLVIFIWLIGLAAVALLWLRTSSKFFKFAKFSKFFKPESSYPGGDQGSPGGGDAIAR